MNPYTTFKKKSVLISPPPLPPPLPGTDHRVHITEKFYPYALKNNLKS